MIIIKGERITSSRSATSLLRHLLQGEENDRITLVQGTEEDRALIRKNDLPDCNRRSLPMRFVDIWRWQSQFNRKEHRHCRYYGEWARFLVSDRV
jgi:hypothetical protein